MSNCENWKRSFGESLEKIMEKDEIQKMIDLSIAKAIDKHNKTASFISACIGAVLLGFYAHGVLAVVDKIR
jgi:hypothetical protein